MDLLKVPRFPCQEKLHNKGNLNLAKKGSEGFISPGVFNRICATRSKSITRINLKPKSELIIFIFLKVALKTAVVDSVDGKHSIFNLLGSSESYRNVNS